MHDYPDDKAVKILRNTISAMSSVSVIIIDEMILPDKNAHWRATQMDITMMASLAGLERTVRQWEALLRDAGLDLIEQKVYTEGIMDSIIVAKPEVR